MLDNTTCRDSFTQFVKAPANLVVLEGDCLDVTGDAGELESYLVCQCLFMYSYSMFSVILICSIVACS